MANVTCEYDSGSSNSMHRSATGATQHPATDASTAGRRVRRSEDILRQAAECVSRGETFQTVSDMFSIPISTIRFYMARKGILPRRKRGRTAILPFMMTANNQAQQPHSQGGSLMQQLQQNPLSQTAQNRSDSVSPTEPPYHFANYKLPELRPKLV